MGKSVRIILPWLITCVALTYLISTTDFYVVWETLAPLPIVHFLVAILLFVMLMYLVDVVTYRLLFSRFFHPVSFLDLFSFKGASYLLQVFHYYLSGAVMAGVLHIRHNVSLVKCFSGLAWLAMLDLVAVALLLTVGYFFSSGMGSEEIKNFVLVCTVLIVLVFSLLSLAFRMFPRLLEWNKFCRIFYIFSRVRLIDFSIFILFRCGYIFLMILSNWYVLPFFGMTIPLSELLLLLPVLVLIGSVPLTSVAGLGTAQVVMRYLYADYAPNGDAQIDAFAITIVIVTVLARSVIGVFWMPRVAREVDKIERIIRKG